MSALILKSGNALNAEVESMEFSSYKKRVMSDGGIILNEQAVRDAFAFVAATGIVSSEVFSATSESWGVKLQDSSPAKLYSLFNASGDIDVSLRRPEETIHNTTAFGFPVTELARNNYNRLITVGKTGEVKSSGICVISRVPVLAGAEDYGSSSADLIYSYGDLSELSNSTTAAEAIAKNIHSGSYRRAFNTVMPDEWFYFPTALGLKRDVTTAGTEVKGANKWNHTATYLDSSKLSLIEKGNIVGTNTLDAPNPYNTGLQFTIGARKDVKTTTGFMHQLVGYVAEAWCLVNTSEEHMAALSLRASQKYTN